MVRLLEVAIVPLFLGVSVAYAQFTSGVNLVEVYATVTDQQGQPIGGLTADDFRIAEDGVRQAITTFTSGEFPLAIAIGLDRSFSMGGKDNRIGLAKSAARTLIGALRPGDQLMVVAIGGDTTVAAALSADRAAALAAIERLDVWGTTPLYDATLGALDAIQPARGRRALVLVSDGSDRYSDTKADELVDRARQHDVLIYPVAVGASRSPIFAELAAATGGRSFFVHDPAALNETMKQIANELRFQYLLGYVPPAARAGQPSWHAIDVTVARPDAKVRARDGYQAR
jgi:Ca-activated chloride channel homolog